MDYVTIKNIEKYHPGYTDRTLIWCKVYFSMLNSDPEFEMLCEIDKWRFVSFLMLQLQSRKPVPIDPEYLSRKGFDFKKRDMSLTLQMLHNFVTLVTEQDDLLLRKVEPCDTQSRVEKSREEKSRVDTIAYVDFEKSTLAAWNLLCDSYPVLSKVNHISESRRKSLKKRYEQPTFRAFETIIGNIPGQKFLLGENDRGWKVSFDWLIKNDINHIKILEGKYGTDSAEIPEYLRSIIK